ncbi:ABC transporter permease [Castellaniella sp.]|uniref:ABC transporter permease n=1 Tax=Castellaniella sp. TaxID=1955812 RepID=UPI00355FB2F3
MKWLQSSSQAYAHWAGRHAFLATLAPFALLVVLWQVVVWMGVFPRVFLPGPADVLARAGDLVYKGILTGYLSDSLIRLAVGTTAGVIVAIPLGVLIGLNRTAHWLCWPILLFFQAIGDIAWLPILLVWFGFGLETITFVLVYTVLFPVTMNTVLGVRSVPEQLLRAARSLGASRVRVLFEVILPGALPNIMTGLRNGLAFGWRALIAAEIIVGTSGIGFLMFDARRAGSVEPILVGLVVLGVLWYLVDGWILAPIERLTGQRWGLVTQD